jgi:hypothetical protein
VARVLMFNGRQIKITAFTDIVGECETLEFRTIRPEGREIEIAISRPDDEPGRLYLSVNGEVDVDYAAWAIEYARQNFAS